MSATNIVDFQISSTDRLAWLKVGSGKITRNLNRRSTFQGILEDQGRGYTPAVGSPIVIGELTVGTIFAGLVTDVDTIPHERTTQLQHTIKARDYSVIADWRRTARVTYENQTLGTIVNAIVTNYMSGEGIDTTNVATGPTITEEVKFDYARCSDAFNRLSQITGYFWYIDSDKFLYFDQFTSNTAPFNLTYPSADFGDVHRIRTLGQYRNRQHVRTDYEISVGVNVATRNDTSEQTSFATTTGGSGIVEAVSENRGIRTQATLQSIGDGLLRQWSEIPDKLTFMTRRSGLEPGQQITITDSRFGISAVQYLIEKVEYGIPKQKIADWFSHKVTVTSLEPYSRPAASYFERVAELVAIPEPVAEVVDESTEVQSTYLKQQTLTTASTSITDGVTSPNQRDMLTVELTQDATGGRQITWAAEFDSSTPVNIDTRANKVTRLFFVYVSSKWKLVGQPVTS